MSRSSSRLILNAAGRDAGSNAPLEYSVYTAVGI